MKFLLCAFVVLASFVLNAQVITPDFSIPDTVCVNTPVNIVNTSVGATSYYWNFCTADLNKAPLASNLGNVSGNLTTPVFMDYVFDTAANKYYGFLINYDAGSLVRLDFGNSLLNQPTSVYMGNFGGAIPPTIGAEGIQVVKNEGKWYAIIVGGWPTTGNQPRITKLDFGTNIANLAPVATNWGNLGNMSQPIDLHLFREAGNWYGFTVNAENNTITRFNFTNSFDNVPTALDLGNIGNLEYPTGIYAIDDNGNWKVFITNAGDNTRGGGNFSITRLDFGSSLLNVPTGVNLGNPGNLLKHPRDLTIMKSCGQVVGFVVNGHPNYPEIIKLDFHDVVTSAPTAVSLGNVGNLNFPHSISKLFRVNEDIFGFVTNVANGTITRLQFKGCTNSSIPSSSAKQPPPITYNAPGYYNINLTTDVGLPSQSAICKQIYVSACNNNVISTADTTICAGAATKLRTEQGIEFKWTPASFLDDSASANPTTTTPDNIDYIVEAKIPGENIVINGDFSQGNTGFTSQYNYVNVNTFESEYFVSNSANSWNQTFSNCGDHTLGNGNMLLANGSNLGSQTVWSQTVTVTPNTDYAFSAWIQALYPQNPALLVFAIDNSPIGIPIEANLPVCNWTQSHATWNSGSKTSVTIGIVNVNPQYLGNDFALDDISFAPFHLVKDTVHISVSKPIIKTNNDTAICSGNKINLNTTGGISYSWAPNNTLSSVAIANPVAKPTVNTQYIVTGTDVKGCKAKDTMVVTINPKPNIIMSDDSLLCKDAPLQLNASGGSQYSWQPATGLSDPSIANPIATISNNTVYTVSVTGANGCTNTDSVHLNISPYPHFSISGAKEICIGQDIELNASGGDKYEWTSSENISNPFSRSLSVHPVTSTEYTAHVSESYCNYDTTMSVNVSVQAIPLVAVQKSNDINCNTPTAQLFATGATNYTWTPTTGMDNPMSGSPTISIDSTITYTVKGINEFGCEASGTVTLNATKTGVPRFVVPNAFTPNGDGKNDCFGIKRWGNAVIKQFTVYDRWGQIVFKTNDPSQCWDGSLKGKPMDSGAYAYIITAFTICGEVSRKGLVMLIR